MKRSILASIIALVAVFLTFGATGSYAYVRPTFPSCLNPQGQVQVYYNDGTHGVPGDSKTYSGYDAVYYLTDESSTQCLCANDGSGIQTNWWKVSSLTQNEITQLTYQGWTYVPDGSVWGLQHAPYLAQNSRYTCTGGNGGGSGGQVLGLASTGNTTFITSIAFFGLIFVSAGLVLTKFRHKDQK